MKMRQLMFAIVSIMLVIMGFSCTTVTTEKSVRRAARAGKIATYRNLASLQETDCGGVRPGITGVLVADSGFRPHPHGFSFPNYSNEFPEGNLRVEDVRTLFGDQVCKSIKDGKCLPTTAAHLWLKNMNAAMEIGHCEGMAVLSAWFFTEQSQLEEYGQSTTFSLTPEKTSLLRSIAYYWTLQALEPVASEYMHFQTKTPTEILNILIEAIITGQEFYTLGIYGSFGGHSITPYAVEDIGNGIFWIHVYDNNYPCAYKYVEIDTNLNTWHYAAGAINPQEDPIPWEGSTGSIDLTSLSIRQQPVECPFCQDVETGCSSDGRLAVLMNSKGSSISATNRSGQEVRLDEAGQLINQIPGAKLLQLKGPEPNAGISQRTSRTTLIMLPPDPQYTFDLTGHTMLQQAETVQVGVFQPCQSFIVDRIELKPGQQNQLVIADGGRFRYSPGDKESPRLRLATYNPGASDGLYTVKDMAINAGASFDIGIDPEISKIRFGNDDPELESFDLSVTLVDEEGNIERISFNDIKMEDDEQAVFGVDEEGNWDLGIGFEGEEFIDGEEFYDEEFGDEEFEDDEFDDDYGYDDDDDWDDDDWDDDDWDDDDWDDDDWDDDDADDSDDDGGDDEGDDE